MNRETSLVLGAGQVGPMVAEQLLAAGQTVRVGRRQATPSRVDGVENVAVDVRDPEAVARAADGASVVYHCVNPLYHEWPEMLLPMTRGIVEGAAKAGARLVVLDNLYMYGDTTHMTEDSPMAPVSKKGALRVQAAEVLLEADAQGRVPVAIGRAADFFGPHTPRSMVMGPHFFQRVLSGKSALFLGDPDQLHSYSYTPDVAAGLVALGREAARGVWMLPVQPAETSRDVLARFGRALGTEVRVTRVPIWVLRAAGIFWKTGAEIAEMTYQWRQPYVLDDTRFRARFGILPTPWDEAVRATADWGRGEFGKAGEQGEPGEPGDKVRPLRQAA